MGMAHTICHTVYFHRDLADVSWAEAAYAHQNFSSCYSEEDVILVNCNGKGKITEK